MPGDLIEEILVWLPAENLCRLSSVCKEWNTLFSSTRFFTTQWEQAPPNKNPLLLVGAVDYDRDCFAYSSFTRSWKRSPLALSFIEEKEGAAPYPSPFRYLASGAGLFLIGGIFTDSIYICNPFTGKCFTLTTLTFRKHYLMGEMGITQEGKDGYKVVLVHTSRRRRRKIVEIYDSTEKAWKVAGVLQRNLTLYTNATRREGIVFSGLGFFYCLTVTDTLEGILSFNMREGTSVFVPLPRDADAHVLFSHLVNCGSRILLVQEIEKELESNDSEVLELEQEEEVVVWEYIDNAETKWKPIARMPPTMFGSRHFLTEPLTILQCVGMGDCVYFRTQGDRLNEVGVYNLTRNSWSMLPNCPCPRNEIFDNPALVGFTPRPDMKVD